MTQFHFIAGLPRSGSTLLSAILQQNPSLTTSMSSPVASIFSATQKALSQNNEAGCFITNDQRKRILKSIFTEYYKDKDIVLDTNRTWPSKIHTLVDLFPTCKIVCCVRPVSWVIDSIESLVRKNCYELSGIFNYEPFTNVFSRANGLCSPGGIVGSALDNLKDAFYSQYSDRLLFVEYEALARFPKETLKEIYTFLDIPEHKHNFKNIKQIPGADEFDRKLGTPGLHKVRSEVQLIERASVLPTKLFQSFEAPFWRTDNSKVKVIYVKENNKNA